MEFHRLFGDIEHFRDLAVFLSLDLFEIEYSTCLFR